MVEKTRCSLLWLQLFSVSFFRWLKVDSQIDLTLLSVSSYLCLLLESRWRKLVIANFGFRWFLLASSGWLKVESQLQHTLPSAGFYQLLLGESMWRKLSIAYFDFMWFLLASKRHYVEITSYSLPWLQMVSVSFFWVAKNKKASYSLL